MTAAWLAVDPGMQTGVIARHGTDLLAWDVVEPIGRPKPRPGEVISPEHLADVLTSVRAIWRSAHAMHDVRLVVEGLNKPSGRHNGELSFIRPGDLLAPAIILGALRAMYPEALVVAPNRHGRRTLSTYPEQLITPGERRHGLDREAPQSSILRHARSAWDVAESAARVVALTRR